MRIILTHPQENIINILRHLGYSFQKHVNDEIAFIRPLSRSGFPRFHIYAKIEKETIVLNLHLDQHKETYGKGAMHHGDYGDGDALKNEITRIKHILKV